MMPDEPPSLKCVQYSTGEEGRAIANNSSKSELWLCQSRNNAQLWLCLVMKVKITCYKEQYCIGTWNVRSMNQGKLDVVKQEMARVNINISGASKPK